MPRQRARKPRKRPLQARSRATVDAILAATARVLVREGYDHASTNRIAAAAGVSIGSVYQYFPSKEALVAELIERHLAQRIALISEHGRALADAPLREAVPAFVRAVIAAQRLDQRMQRVFVEQVPRVAGLDRLLEFDRQVTALLSRYLHARRAELQVDDIDLAAFLMMNAVRGATLAAILDPPSRLDPEVLVAELSRLVLGYLCGTAGSR